MCTIPIVSSPTSRAVRQGCCPSPLLYAFRIEAIADIYIQGFNLPAIRHETHIIQYVEDFTLVLIHFDSAKYIFFLCELYGMPRGA